MPSTPAAKPQINLVEALEALTARVNDIETELKDQIEDPVPALEAAASPPQFIGLTDVSGTRRVVGLAHIAHVTPVHDQEGVCAVKLSLTGVPPLMVRADINEIHSALVK